MTKLDQLQELSDLVDGLANEKTVEALGDLNDKLEDIASFADEDDEKNLQAANEIIDGLTAEKTVEALGDLNDKLEDIAAFADDEKLQAANEIIDNIANPKTVELLDNVASSLDSLIEKIDALRDLDDAISNVAAYSSVVEELVSNLDNALRLKTQLDEVIDDE